MPHLPSAIAAALGRPAPRHGDDDDGDAVSVEVFEQAYDFSPVARSRLPVGSSARITSPAA